MFVVPSPSPSLASLHFLAHTSIAVAPSDEWLRLVIVVDRFSTPVRDVWPLTAERVYAPHLMTSLPVRLPTSNVSVTRRRAISSRGRSGKSLTVRLTTCVQRTSWRNSLSTQLHHADVIALHFWSRDGCKQRVRSTTITLLKQEVKRRSVVAAWSDEEHKSNVRQ